MKDEDYLNEMKKKIRDAGYKLHFVNKTPWGWSFHMGYEENSKHVGFVDKILNFLTNNK